MATRACADPALWAVRSASATVYLFGTVHLLKSDRPWRSLRIDRALGDAQELWLEVQDPLDKTAIAPLMARYGRDAAHPLSTRLDAHERARLTSIVTRNGLPGIASLEPLRPWVAATYIAMLPLMRAGYDTANGVEKTLADEVAASARPVHGLETLEEQIRFLAALPPKVEIQMLDEAMDSVDEGLVKMEEIVAAWSTGDVDAIERLVVQELATKEPDVYRTLIVDRNKAWAAQLAERLKGRGVCFVAVGAGHLVGPDRLQTQLASDGLTIERQ